MGTHSSIALEKQDGKVEVVYCHYDGYLSHNGFILHEHYQSPEKVQELLSLGDLSSLGEEIGNKQDFDNPVKGTCLFYGRDRGESSPSEKFDSYEEYKSFSCEEYNYILRKDGKWYVRPTGRHSLGEELLSHALLEANIIEVA